MRNLGPDVPLDTIIKKFTIVYSNVKSFDLLMLDFYCTDQGEKESIPSFATQVQGLLSQIHDKFPEKLTHPEEQRLLRDCLFHGCKKSIWDSVSSVLQILAWIICISWRNAEKQRMRTRVDKLNQPHQKPRWQQPQYHPSGRMSWISSSNISSTK